MFHLLGLDSASGTPYLLWSGFFGDLTIFCGAVMLYFKHNCHVKACPRLGVHRIEGTPYIVCTRHSPHKVPSHLDIIKIHKRSNHG